MSTHRWRVGGAVVLLAALAAALYRPSEPAAAAPPEERSFEKDGAVRVTRKGSSESFFLSHPKSVRVGDRAFLYGWKVNGNSALYVPVSEVELIEEFTSIEKLLKAYRLPEPTAPGGNATGKEKR